MRRNVDPSAMLLPSLNQKDIEFVIPPTKPPTTTLYGPSVNCQPLRSPSRHPTSHSDSQGKGSEKSKQDENVVNRGWNFIADVLSATSTFKSSSESSRARARSRDSLPVHNNNNSLDIPTIKTSRSASLVVTSLGLPTIQNATPTSGHSPDLTAPNSRRGSAASNTSASYLGTQHELRRRSRASSRGSIFDLLNAPNQNLMSASAPGSRRGSRPSISIEPEADPESYAQYGGINPSLYLNPEQFDKEEDFPDDHLGRVYYNLYYDEIDEALNVYIQRIRNLPKSTSQSGKTNKTYIKICLLPDERSERKCTQQGDSFAELNPNFSENVVFQVSPANLWGRTLRILVFNIDVNRKHRILGQTLLELADVDLSHGRLNLNADLQKFVNLNDLPELLLSVCYNATLQRITVNAVEGKNFKSLSSDNAPDTYIKLALMNQAKEVKRKKTEIVKKSNNPAFQESFNFKADEKDIETFGVRVTAMQHLNFPEKDKPLGFTVLGGFMFARGTGKDHWEDVMKNQKTHIQKWHKLQDVVCESSRETNSLDIPEVRSRRGSSSLAIPDNARRRRRSASVCLQGPTTNGNKK